jgi:hypothetical protein
MAAGPNSPPHVPARSMAPAPEVVGLQARAGYWRWLPWAVAAAACIGLVVVLMWDRQPDNDVAGLTRPTGVAVLGTSVEARWGGSGPARMPGSVLSPGTLKLESGVAQIEFYSGARLIVQGPAEVQLVSELEASCCRGRLTAFVPPPARGFKLSAPGLVVVDLGTEFGLNVQPGGAPEVHVFSGRVEVNRPDAVERPVQLNAGEAAMVDGDSFKPMPSNRRGFLDEVDLGRLASNESQQRREAWLAAAAKLSRDEAALVHFTFHGEPDWGRAIANRVVKGNAPATAAAMVGCGWSEGRWVDNRSVEFNGPGDRLRLNVPDQFKAITLLAWVRIDALQNSCHALLTPDGLAPGTVRWELSREGELRLGIARASGRADPNWEVVISPPVITPDHLGQWVQLATTFDGKTVYHFVDGVVVKEGRAYSPAPLLIGPAEVGNWRDAKPRYLQGRMDEFAILSRAMAPQEIKTIFESGCPVALHQR